MEHRIGNSRADRWADEAAMQAQCDEEFQRNALFSDATLTVLNSAMNPNRYIRFKDCFPTSISDIPFDTTLSDVDYVETTATFKFRMFDIETTG